MIKDEKYKDSFKEENVGEEITFNFYVRFWERQNF
jgi:hypothetical protein